MRLQPCIILNPGTETVSEKTMATTVEALIGAVFCDGGEAALGTLLNHLQLDHEYFRPVGAISSLLWWYARWTILVNTILHLCTPELDICNGPMVVTLPLLLCKIVVGPSYKHRLH